MFRWPQLSRKRQGVPGSLNSHVAIQSSFGNGLFNAAFVFRGFGTDRIFCFLWRRFFRNDFRGLGLARFSLPSCSRDRVFRFRRSGLAWI